MCGCNNNIPPVQYSAPQVVYTPDPNCGKTELDIRSVQFRMVCLKSKIPVYDYNKYMGILNTLINLRDYCRYDIEPLILLLNEKSC
jgi:hypothetical protein